MQSRTPGTSLWDDLTTKSRTFSVISRISGGIGSSGGSSHASTLALRMAPVLVGYIFLPNSSTRRGASGEKIECLTRLRTIGAGTEKPELQLGRCAI